jgi:hypothetical protein
MQWQKEKGQTMQWQKEKDRQITLLLLFNHNRVRVMVFIATFNNISAILWQSVLLVEEIGVPRENHRPAASH